MVNEITPGPENAQQASAGDCKQAQCILTSSIDQVNLGLKEDRVELKFFSPPHRRRVQTFQMERGSAQRDLELQQKVTSVYTSLSVSMYGRVWGGL